jgi:streptomycin 6-kinase
MFDAYLDRWGLARDGDPITTHSSDLLPVRSGHVPAMLKVARSDEERRGANLMARWNGNGAARVLAHHEDAILLERARGRRSLATMAREGHDDEASRIICGVAMTLHAHDGSPPTGLVPLSAWYAELSRVAGADTGIFTQAASTAAELLASPQEQCVLHGDLHHGNVLDFGARGWLAIDPKGLIGERGFDFANIFCNPDFEIATSPGRLVRQIDVVAETARLDPARLLRWVLAYAGLSAAWTIGEGGDPTLALTIAHMAAAEITTA